MASNVFFFFFFCLSSDDLTAEIPPGPKYDRTDGRSAPRHSVADDEVTMTQDMSQLESRRDRAGYMSGSDEQRNELRKKERRVQDLEYQNKELMEKLRELEEKSRAELEVRDREIERLYSTHGALSTNGEGLELTGEKSGDTGDERLRGVPGDEGELVEKIIDLQQRHKQLEQTAGEAEDVKRINRELARKVDDGLISKQELKQVEAQRQEMALKIRELEKAKEEAESRLRKQVESLRKENAELAGKVKEVDEMKQNVIRLTAQLRAMDSGEPNATELQELREKLNTVELEKSRVQSALDELQRETAPKNDLQELQLDNITLEEKSKDGAAELRLTIEQLRQEVKQNDMYRHKYVELTAVESVSAHAPPASVELWEVNGLTVILFTRICSARIISRKHVYQADLANIA